MAESRPPRPKLPRSVWALGAVSLLTDIASDMCASLLPMFLATLPGGSAAALGWIEGAAGATSAVFKYLSGSLADRVKRNKPLVLLGYSLSTLARPFLALAAAPWHVVAVRVADRIGKGIRSSPRDAILAADTQPEHRAYAFGLHRAMDNLGAVLGPLLATALLFAMPGRLRTVFWVATIPGALAVAVLYLGVRENTVVQAVSKATSPPSEAAIARPMRRFLAVVALFALADASDLFLLVKARDLGVDPEFIPLVWGLLSLLRALTTVPGGRLADRLGRLWALSLGWVLYALAYAGFGLSHTLLGGGLSLLVYGAYYGLTEGAQRAMVASFAAREGLGRAYGAFNLVTGLCALPASLWFGALYPRDHGRTAFLVASALSLCAAGGLKLISRARPA